MHADDEREDWETDFVPGMQHVNSNPQLDSDAQYDLQAQYDSQFEVDLGEHSVVGEHSGYVDRSHVHSTHMYGMDANRSTFTPPQVYAYRNYAPGLNLNARFYS